MDGTAGAGSGLVAGDGPDPVVHSLDETPSGCLVAPAPGGAGRRAGLLRSDYTVLLYTRGLGHACGGRKDRRAGMGRHATDDRTARSRRAHTRRVNPLRVNTGDPRSGAIGATSAALTLREGCPGDAGRWSVGKRHESHRETPACRPLREFLGNGGCISVIRRPLRPLSSSRRSSSWSAGAEGGSSSFDAVTAVPGSYRVGASTSASRPPRRPSARPLRRPPSGWS